jgi:hypothetical protein
MRCPLLGLYGILRICLLLSAVGLCAGAATDLVVGAPAAVMDRTANAVYFGRRYAYAAQPTYSIVVWAEWLRPEYVNVQGWWGAYSYWSINGAGWAGTPDNNFRGFKLFSDECAQMNAIPHTIANRRR